MKKIFTVALLFCSLLSKAQTFTWNGHSQIEPELNDTIVIPVSGLPDSINNNFGISTACFSIYHPSKTNLLIMLVAPDGHSVLLMEGHGVVGENFIGTCLGMDGIPFELGTPPFTGNFLPSGDISTLNNGQNPNGNWLLIVNNHHSEDTGSVRQATITFSNNPPQGNGVGSGSNTGPTGPFIWPGTVCPGGASSCDLLPDMTASALHILNTHTEEPGQIKISNATPNIGNGPIEIYAIDSCFCNGVPSPCNVPCADGSELKHMIKQRIYRKRPNTDTLDYYDRDAGAMTYHPTHNHLHVDNWANFTLRTATSDPDPRNWPIIGTSVKQSYCLVNLGTCAGRPGECKDVNGNTVLTVPNNGMDFQPHLSCGLNQRISPGSLDIYGEGLNSPILLNNICNGSYYLVSITDPDNRFLETDETNNWVAVPITLTKQMPVPTITSSSTFLCGEGDDLVLTASPNNHYAWSTGDTTQSIVVTAPGSYTVTGGCGASTPFVVTTLSPDAHPSVAIAITSGSIPSCPGNRITFKATPVFGGNTPSYQWKVNGANAGSNIDSFVLTSSGSSQVVSCSLTSSIDCFAGQEPVKDSITIPVSAVNTFEAVVTQTRGYNPFCPGDTVTFKAEAVPGAEAVYQWKVDGSNVGANSPEFTSSSLQQGQIVSCDITAIPVCGNIASVGIPAGYNENGTTDGAAYPTWYGNGHQQYLVRATELHALGLSAGVINRLSFITGAGAGNPDTLKGYTIRLAQVGQVALNSIMINTPFTTVFGPVDYRPVTNDTNIHNFSAPFIWNGSSNLLVDICFASGVYGSASYKTVTTNTGFTSGTIYQRDYFVASPCDTTVSSFTTTKRPYMIFSNSTPKTVNSNQVTLERLEPVYHFTGNGNWNIATNWENSKIPPQHVLHCAEIIIDPVAGGECILNTKQVVAPGARITVVAGKKFRVVGNVLIQE